MGHAEGAVDVVRGRMHLQAQILSAHRIEEIKADRELCAEARIHLRTQQRLRLVQHQILSRQFHGPARIFQQQGVLLRHAVKAPGIVLRLGIQIALLLHPLAAPDARVKIRHGAERPLRRLPQSLTEHVAGDHLRIIRMIGVDDIVHALEQCRLVAVRQTPFHEVAALKLAQDVFVSIVTVVVAHACAVAQLDLPAGHVKVHQQISGRRQRSAEAVDDHKPAGFPDLPAGCGQLLRIQIFFQSSIAHAAEDAVIGQEALHAGCQIFWRRKQILHGNQQIRIQLPQLRQDFLIAYTRIRIGSQNEIRPGDAAFEHGENIVIALLQSPGNVLDFDGGKTVVITHGLPPGSLRSPETRGCRTASSQCGRNRARHPAASRP